MFERKYHVSIAISSSCSSTSRSRSIVYNNVSFRVFTLCQSREVESKCSVFELLKFHGTIIIIINMREREKNAEAWDRREKEIVKKWHITVQWYTCVWLRYKFCFYNGKQKMFYKEWNKHKQNEQNRQSECKKKLLKTNACIGKCDSYENKVYLFLRIHSIFYFFRLLFCCFDSELNIVRCASSCNFICLIMCTFWTFC